MFVRTSQPLDFTRSAEHVPRPATTQRISLGGRAWRNGAVAQLGERLVRNEEVRGSIPLSSTTVPLHHPRRDHAIET